MPYAAAVTWGEREVAGVRYLTLKVVETLAASGSEWSTVHSSTNTVTHGDSGTVGDIPSSVLMRYTIGTVVMRQVDRSAGTGTTVQPKLGKTSGWTTATPDVIFTWDPADAADYVHSVAAIPYAFPPTGAAPVFYGRSTPNNAAADHTITTLYTIRSGV